MTIRYHVVGLQKHGSAVGPSGWQQLPQLFPQVLCLLDACRGGLCAAFYYSSIPPVSHWSLCLNLWLYLKNSFIERFRMFKLDSPIQERVLFLCLCLHSLGLRHQCLCPLCCDHLGDFSWPPSISSWHWSVWQSIVA